TKGDERPYRGTWGTEEQQKVIVNGMGLAAESRFYAASLQFGLIVEVRVANFSAPIPAQRLPNLESDGVTRCKRRLRARIAAGHINGRVKASSANASDIPLLRDHGHREQAENRHSDPNRFHGIGPFEAAAPI